MNRRVFLILGVLISILPYLGFPYLIKNVLITLCGLGIIYLAYRLYQENEAKTSGTKTFENFSENHDFVENNTEDVINNVIEDILEANNETL